MWPHLVVTRENQPLKRGIRATVTLLAQRHDRLHLRRTTSLRDNESPDRRNRNCRRPLAVGWRVDRRCVVSVWYACAGRCSPQEIDHHSFDSCWSDAIPVAVLRFECSLRPERYVAARFVRSVRQPGTRGAPCPLLLRRSQVNEDDCVCRRLQCWELAFRPRERTRDCQVPTRSLCIRLVSDARSDLHRGERGIGLERVQHLAHKRAQSNSSRTSGRGHRSFRSIRSNLGPRRHGVGCRIQETVRPSNARFAINTSDSHWVKPIFRDADSYVPCGAPRPAVVRRN